jgi:ferritin-like metal-binding protein YciE
MSLESPSTPRQLLIYALRTMLGADLAQATLQQQIATDYGEPRFNAYAADHATKAKSQASRIDQCFSIMRVPHAERGPLLTGVSDIALTDLQEKEREMPVEFRHILLSSQITALHAFRTSLYDSLVRLADATGELAVMRILAYSHLEEGGAQARHHHLHETLLAEMKAAHAP